LIIVISYFQIPPFSADTFAGDMPFRHRGCRRVFEAAAIAPPPSTLQPPHFIDTPLRIDLAFSSFSPPMPSLITLIRHYRMPYADIDSY
jgi:hypothetical protein